MIERCVYVVPSDTPVTDEVVETARSLGCGEIAQGLPPALEHLAPKELPAVVVELLPEPAPEPPSVEAMLAEIQALKSRLAALEG